MAKKKKDTSDDSSQVESDNTKLSPFDFLNSINYTKVDIIDGNETNEKQYNSFMVNKGLSLHADTIMYANEMNRLFDLPPGAQYKYLVQSIRRRKRTGAWPKKDDNEKDINMICQRYSCNRSVARQYLGLLSESDLDDMRESFNTGG